MWSKFMQYAHLHEVNPDKYPAGRTPVELSTLISDMKELMGGFFGGNDSVLGRMFIFFCDNPILMFLISFGCVFGAFNLVRYSTQIARM